MFHVEHRTPMGTICRRQVYASSVQEVVDIMKIPVNEYPTVCIATYGDVDKDLPILRKDWDIALEYVPEYSECKHLTFMTLPQGDVFNSVLALLATIALTIFAPYAAGFVNTALGLGLASGSLGLQLLQAGIVLAGSFLIGTFLAPSVVDGNKGQASPTYNITGQGNTARLFQAIPKLYGKHIIYPDYASNPYVEYIDNQQYLNQLLCLGLGEYQVHSIRIEDTEFWNETEGFTDTYTGMQLQIVDPGEHVTLFHSQVLNSTEVGGQDLVYWSLTNEVQIVAASGRIGSFNAGDEENQFRLASPGQKIVITSGPNAGTYTIDSVAPNFSYINITTTFPANETATRTIAVADDTAWVGGFAANTADTVTNKIQVDYVFNAGIFYTDDDGNFANYSCTIQVQARKINSAGIAIGSWITLGTHTHTAQTQTPLRFTQSYDVDDARYEVRMRRTTPEDPRARYRSSVQWQGLKAFIPNDNVYPNVTLLALRMLATGQLTQSSAKKINVIETAKIPVYSGGVWTTQATRSIAWAAADILRNTVYGAGFPTQYIDVAKLAVLNSTWAGRGDYFDGIFDTTYSIWDALLMVLKAGRTIPNNLGGRITFVRDEARALPRCQFTPASIVRGSFQTNHILYDDESPDNIIVQFVDNRTWKENEVQCILPGATSAKPERIRLFGITGRNQAWREGIFMAAVNAKRRIVSQFDTELEGRLLGRGDLISVAHDLYDWGQTGNVDAYDTVSRVMYLSESLDWTVLNTQSYIRLRKRDGSSWGPVKMTRHTDVDGYQDPKIIVIDNTDLIIVEAAQGDIEDVFNYEDDSVLTSFIVAKAETSYKDWIVVSGDPKDDGVSLTAIIEDPYVHTVDLGTPPSETYPYTSTTNPSRPVIAFLSVSEQVNSNPNNPTVTFAWGASTLADTYRLQISYDNTRWETIYSGTNTSFVATILPGALFARVQGINTQAGAWKTFEGVFGSGTVTPLPTTAIDVEYSVSGGTLNIDWVAAVRATSYRVKVYSESVVDSGTFNVLEIDRTTTGTFLGLNSAAIIAAGGPWKNIKVGVQSINSRGTSSEVIYIVSDVTINPVTSLSLQSPYTRTSFTLQWATTPADSFTTKIKVDGVTKITYTGYSNTQLVSLTDMTAVGGPWRQIVAEVVAHAGSLSSGTTSLTITAPSITPISGAGGSYDSGTEILTINWNQTTDNAVDKTRVRKNTVNDFATATLVDTQDKAAGVAATYTESITVGTGTLYYFITAYDSVLNQESAAVGLSVTV